MLNTEETGKYSWWVTPKDEFPKPPPSLKEKHHQIWDELFNLVKNDIKISLDIDKLRDVLLTFNEQVLPSKAIRRLIGATVKGYVKGSMNDLSKLDTIIEYMEIIGILIPMSANIDDENQKFAVNIGIENEVSESKDVNIDEK